MELKMKIITGEKDNDASATIYYQPSKYFQEVTTEGDFEEEMTKSISNFINMLEIAHMDYYSTKIFLNKALQGLIEGVVNKVLIDYDGEIEEDKSLEQLLDKLKKRVYHDTKMVIENNYFADEYQPEVPQKPGRNNVIKLKKSLE
jgi:hypothetical protein